MYAFMDRFNNTFEMITGGFVCFLKNQIMKLDVQVANKFHILFVTF